MLIRITGASEGIKEYLEKGQKEGRDFTRDELDERVVLAGDLEFTGQLIDSFESESDRYFHITLAFKEDELSADAMQEIVGEFERFAFSAYRKDEFNLYAEAHVPKIKSYVNRRTGAFIERKPHIHIVIPNVNLMASGDGGVAKPLGLFGKVDRQTNFIDAFQEYINNKYGLASPKENRRLEFTGESEMISRYKGDLFSGGGTDLREAILGAVLERKISSYDDFKALLSEFGETRVRNAGRRGEYFNVKPAGAAKGVNLKDHVFSREFIELAHREKLRELTREIEHTYAEAGARRRDPEHIAETLTEWHEIRAKEIRFVNSGNRGFYQRYKAADRAEKVQILADQQARFYRKYDKDASYDRSRTPDAERIRNNLRAAADHLESAGRSAQRLDRGARNVADRSARRAVAAAVHRYQNDQGRARQSARFTDSRRPVDNLTGQYQAEAAERSNGKRAETAAEFAEIKRRIDARRLLAYLSRTHGVIADKYEVTKDADGADRIKCGRRHLNVSDFLTKELRLTWQEAAPILRECYAAQLAQEPAHEARKAPGRGPLWEPYQKWRAKRAEERTKAWDTQRASEKERRAAINRDFQATKAEINARPGIKPADRRAALSLARMEKVQADKALTARIALERQALKDRYAGKAGDQYRLFLAERAQDGDELALAELRRQRVEPVDRSASQQKLTNGGEQPPQGDGRGREPIERIGPMTYRVAINGNVTYQLDGRDVLRDEPRSVHVLADNESEVIETGLRLAMQKFGPVIKANGTEDFKRRVVEVSVEKGLKVEFTDPALREYRQRLEEAKRAAVHKEQHTMQTLNRRHDGAKPSPAARSAEEEREFRENVRKAKDIDLPAWLMARGVVLKKNGTKEWKEDLRAGDGREAHRFFRSNDGHWLVFDGERTTDAIGYVQQRERLTFVETVRLMSGAQVSGLQSTAQQMKNERPEAAAAIDRKAKQLRPLELKTASEAIRREAHAYAHDERGITNETLAEAHQQGVIAVDNRGLAFIGRDADGAIRNAETRLLKPEEYKGELLTKISYAGSDKTFPPVLRGNDRDVHFVEGGFDALALRDMKIREGQQPPTIIITGGARTRKWQDNAQIRELVQKAESVTAWRDNERDARNMPDAKKQADTDAAHDNQAKTLVEIRGTAHGINNARPPAGIKDLAEWNERQREQEARMRQELERAEENESSMRMRR
ncbi:LPD7 domain-containing protein [Burkholderia vietnamiensis]|uniref:LPD7 domain-containing protein n=1 Tax=Burkholderia vietnamiensis TaxID=60552 RepID=UPI001592EE9F|nr:LPD7 domain-containing protein [Burkholderia vietnamiensis]